MSCCFSFFNWLLGKNDEPDPLEAIHIAEEPGMVIFRNVRTQKECQVGAAGSSTLCLRTFHSLPRRLSASLAQEIIALASPALEPSKVSGSLISPDRTSSSVFFQGVRCPQPQRPCLPTFVACSCPSLLCPSPCR